MTVPERLVSLASKIDGLTRDGVLAWAREAALRFGVGEDEQRSIAEFAVSCSIWRDEGMQRFALSDSIAALFRLTSNNGTSLDRVPHDSFLVSVPGAYFRNYTVDGRRSATVWIMLVTWSHDDVEGEPLDPSERPFSLFVMDEDGVLSGDRLGITGRGSPFGTSPDPEPSLDGSPSWDGHLAERFVANLIDFLVEYPECAVRDRVGKSGVSSAATVRAPSDVVVTRGLRRAACDAASAGTVTEVRRAMAHFVRGHWRNQPVGEGRKDIRRTWVKPHKRGDEAFGRVVERITKVTGGEN